MLRSCCIGSAFRSVLDLRLLREDGGELLVEETIGRVVGSTVRIECCEPVARDDVVHSAGRHNDVWLLFEVPPNRF
jgi:hypothetical protein